MASDLVVPPSIEAVIQEFNRAEKPFTELDVEQALGKARSSIQNPTEDENFGAWAEVLAFALVDSRMHRSPWRTYFAPMGSGTDKNGNITYFPDIAGADARVIAHWTGRAKNICHPVLKARYADLAWDMCAVIAKQRRDAEMARLAIDAYLASIPASIVPELHNRFVAALRALDLASLIKDPDRTERARGALLRLHREVMDTRDGQWWLAFDRLIADTRAGVTDEERQQLLADLENIVLYYGDTSKSQIFNPHVVQDAAKRLIRHYTRIQQTDDVKRLHISIAGAFEHFAGLGDAMVASAVLQTAVNAYRDAGMPEDSKRVRILMEDKFGHAHEHMATIETEIKISREDMDGFLKTIVTDNIGSTFVRIAAEFLPNKGQLEKQVQKALVDAPLFAHMPQTIMADDHVAAKIGSVEDDPFGRLIHQTTMNFGFAGIWLRMALHRTIETHGAVPEHFVGWCNRSGLFEDVTFLNEGVRAWYEGDLAKAVHVLVPQMERGLRSIVAKLDRPVTKPHSKIAGVGVAIGMGDILYAEEMTQALGPDITLYFLALYADPRGMNLRNRVAHGLIKPELIDGHLVELLIHTLLIFGIWKELAQKRR